MKINRFILLLVFTLLTACTQVDDGRRFSLMPSNVTGIHFQNRVGETEQFNVLEYGYLYNGGGVAAGDFNNDGLIDLYFTGNMVGSHLYLNKGNLEFEEIAKNAGVFAAGLWNTGVTVADVNNDGYLDIYICRSAAEAPSKRKNVLFINNGDLTFTEKADEYGIADTGYSTQASFFDYDNDGDLDLYVLNHATQEFAGFSQITPSLKKRTDPDFSDKLYRNDGGRFTDVSQKAGLLGNVLGFGLGLAVSDINNDGWLDIYISNDYNEQDYLYINNKDGSFLESLSEYIGHTSLFSMGSDVGDVNNDGFTDIVSLDMLPEDNYRQKMVSGPDNYEKFSKLAASGFYHQTMRNMLQLNNAGTSFSEIGQFAGISNTDWSWAPLIADFDNDGLKDIYITNGYKRDYTNMDFMNYAVQQKQQEDKTGTRTSILALLDKMPATIVPNYMYHNQNGIRFTKSTEEWGMDHKSLSNGAAYADLDNDGDLDLIVNNLDEPAFVYRNNTVENGPSNYLKIRLKGPPKNTMGIGARVVITSMQSEQVQEFIPTRGYQSAMSAPLHFGLPLQDSLVSVSVSWPSGHHQNIPAVRTKQQLVLDYANAKKTDREIQSIPAPLLTDRSTDSLLIAIHKKNNYNDFRNERLLPHKLSAQGPRMAKADVNADGLDDIFIPGGKDSESMLFVQKQDGRFQRTNNDAFNEITDQEAVNALFFDCDMDGDQDLYVVMGGNEFPENSAQYQDRLYTNDGRGNFKYSPEALPKNHTSNLAIAHADVDGDGDEDLFIGGRLIPGNYPEIPISQLLINNGNGRFLANTGSWRSTLDTIGMVTDAFFEDLDGDQRYDLVLSGEWMPLSVFQNTGTGFEQRTEDTALSTSHGWWNSLHPMDVDNDGDIDFVAGNHGLNSQLKASQKMPVSLYTADYDENGTLDPVLNSYIMEKEYPVFSKDDMTDQLTMLKSKYVNYSDYAEAQMTDIFTKDQLQQVDTLRPIPLAMWWLKIWATLVLH